MPVLSEKKKKKKRDKKRRKKGKKERLGGRGSVNFLQFYCHLHISHRVLQFLLHHYVRKKDGGEREREKRERERERERERREREEREKREREKFIDNQIDD
jgi:hypothetical protein